MEITNAKYYAPDGINIAINVTINGKTMSVPIDENNRHYLMLLEWLAEGNTPEPAE